MSDFRACAIIPTYDNPATVERVVREVRAHVPCVILVDDGSHAPASEVLDRISGEAGVVLVRHAHNRGKGAAMKSGLAEAAARDFTHALQVDADGQHDLQDIPRFLAIARDEPNALVLAEPKFDETRPPLRGFGHWFTILWTRIEVAGNAIADPQCGFRVYPVTAARAAKARGDRMEYDPEVAVRMCWAGSPIVNVATRVRYLEPSEGGVSHFHMGRDNLLISWMHTRLVTLAILRWLLRPFRRSSSAVARPSASRSSHWLRIPELGSALGITIFVWTIGLCGRAVARALLWPVVFYYALFAFRARRASRAFLRRIGQPAGWWSAYRHLLRFGQVALDRVLFVQGKNAGMEPDLGPRDLLQELQSSPRGALLLGAHVGSFEALGGMARELGLEVNAVVNTSNSRTIMTVLERLDPTLPARLIDLGGDRLEAIFEIRERLGQGRHIGVLADRCSPAERSVVVPFMGQDAKFPAGPYILAATLGCPVYFVAALYRGGNRYEIHAERFAERITLDRNDRSAGLRKWATLYADKLEALARREPTNWFNFYDFWSLDE